MPLKPACIVLGLRGSVGSVALVALLGMGELKAQLRNANWVFGTNLWVSFQDGSFTMLPHNDQVSRRCGQISDVEGNLLLAVDDRGIRNAQFDPVAGGTALELGWEPGMANFLVLPHPGDPERYFVFAVEGAGEHRAGHVEVDASANGGAGEVVGAGTTWFMAHCTAKLTGALDAEGTGYWIVLHADEGDAFHAYHLTPTGLIAAPVISHTGRAYVFDTGADRNMDRWGQLAFSVQGDKLAAINQGVAADSNGIDLLAFDPMTGHASTIIQLDHNSFRYDGVPLSYQPTLQQMPGSVVFSALEFELTGSYLYAMNYTNNGVGHLKTTQYPLYHGSPQLIADSAWDLGIYWSYQPIGDELIEDVMFTGLDGLLYIGSTHATPTSALPVWIRVSNTPCLDYRTALADPHTEFSLLPEGVFWGEVPNQCRNYHDSHPIGLGLAPEENRPSFRVWPNPMGRQATLQWSGKEQPTAVRWFDAWGRLVRQERFAVGPASMIQRGDLPTGLYVLQLLAGSHPLGTVRMVCE